MAVRCFGSVTVRDASDVGSILCYLTSNQPSSVVYDPNQNTYTPNWGTSNLVLTPVIQYNGSALQLNTAGLVITYRKMEGSTVANLGQNEVASLGVLTVSANKIASVASGQLTYICNIVFTDPTVGVPIENECSITFTLLSQASDTKSIEITGENTFLYDTDRNVVGSGSITLTAHTNNVSVQQWQYKTSNGTFAAFPNTNNQSITGTTLVVAANESGIWLNNRSATIKVQSSDSNIYDIHEIVKIYDGTAGNATLVCHITNSTHYVPCDANGSVTSWNGSSTTVQIFEGGTDVTNDWTITPSLGNGLTGTYDSTTHTFTPSGLTDDTSYCDFVCTQTGYSDLTARYTITKSKMGSDGEDAVIYSIEPSNLVLNKSESGAFTPSNITFNSRKIIGDSPAIAYSGIIRIQESTDGSTFSTVYTSSSNESSKLWTPTSSSVKIIKGILFEAGGTTTTLDEQTVIVTSDGATGAAGADSISMGLGNYQDVIPCTESGYTSQTRDVSIPFYAYLGIQRVAATATVGTLPTGITVKSNTASTTSADGLLVLTIANNSALGNASTLTGDITITLSTTVDSQAKTVATKYTWTKNPAARAIGILQIYSEDGGIIRNSSGSTTLNARLIYGGSEVTPTSIQWAKYGSGSYTNISGATSTTLTVTDTMVDDLAFFRATATYNNKSYTAFYTVDDIQDPVMAVVHSTVQHFRNSQGFGAVYCRIYQAGVELDPIRSTTFSDTAPTAPQSGDFYYHLDTTNKTCVLKKYNGSAWANATETDTYTYSYYRRDSAGNALDTTTPYKTQRCFYVDPSIINGTMSFDCEVND